MKKAIITGATMMVVGFVGVLALESVSDDVLLIGLVLMMVGFFVIVFRGFYKGKPTVFEGLAYLAIGLALSPVAAEDDPHLLFVPHLMAAWGAFWALRTAVMSHRMRRNKPTAAQQNQYVRSDSVAQIAPKTAVCSECGCERDVGKMKQIDGGTYCSSCAKQIVSDKIPLKEQVAALFATNKGIVTVSEKPPLYILWFSESGMPLCHADRMCIFTSYEGAERVLKEKIKTVALRERISIVRYDESVLSSFWSECSMAGFDKAVVDGKALTTLRNFADYTDGYMLPISNIPLCNGMLLLKQTAFFAQYDATKAEDSARVLSLKEKLFGLLTGAVTYVGKGEPITVETEVGRCVAVFTDAYAIKRFGGSEERLLPFSKAAASAVRRVTKDDALWGVVVNPGRENWVISKTECKTLLPKKGVWQ